jgi:thiamine biosynthesis lipoprotein
MQHPDSQAPRRPSRRDVIALGIGALAVAAVPFARRRPRRLVRRTIPVMGTLAEVGVVHSDERYAHLAIDGAFDELRAVERLMTRFDDRSDVGRVNRLADDDAVQVSDHTHEVLHEAVGWAEASDGAFDPCLARVMELWDLANRSAPPPKAEVQRLAGRRLYKGLDLGTHRGRPAVRITDPYVAIDLGGIGKGYGVDRAVQALRDWGIENGLANVGGDLYALGTSEDGDPWRVGVRSPDDPDKLSGKLEVTNAAVATSGDYLQYFQHGGQRYHHLIDPATGSPRVGAAHSVTVQANLCITADAAATTAFGMQPEEAQELLVRRPGDARIVSAL